MSDSTILSLIEKTNCSRQAHLRYQTYLVADSDKQTGLAQMHANPCIFDVGRLWDCDQAFDRHRASIISAESQIVRPAIQSR